MEMGPKGRVGVRRDFLSIQKDGRTRELDPQKMGAGLVGRRGLVGSAGLGLGFVVEHLSPWDPQREDPWRCLQGVSVGKGGERAEVRT